MKKIILFIFLMQIAFAQENIILNPSPPEKYVTLYTDQFIPAFKHFHNVTIDNLTIINVSSYNVTGDIRITGDICNDNFCLNNFTYFVPYHGAVHDVDLNTKNLLNVLNINLANGYGNIYNGQAYDSFLAGDDALTNGFQFPQYSFLANGNDINLAPKESGTGMFYASTNYGLGIDNFGFTYNGNAILSFRDNSIYANIIFLHYPVFSNFDINTTQKMIAKYFIGNVTIYSGDNFTYITNNNTINVNLSKFDDRYASANIEYYLYNESASDVNFKKMNSTIPTDTRKLIINSSLSGTQLLTQWINEKTNLTSLKPTIVTYHFHALKLSGTKSVSLHAELYLKNSSGEYLISTSEQSENLPTIETQFEIHGDIPNTINMNITDILIAKLISTVTGSGTNPSVEIIVEGNTVSSMSFNVNTESLTESDPFYFSNPLLYTSNNTDVNFRNGYFSNISIFTTLPTTSLIAIKEATENSPNFVQFILNKNGDLTGNPVSSPLVVNMQDGSKLPSGTNVVSRIFSLNFARNSSFYLASSFAPLQDTLNNIYMVFSDVGWYGTSTSSSIIGHNVSTLIVQGVPSPNFNGSKNQFYKFNTLTSTLGGTYNNNGTGSGLSGFINVTEKGINIFANRVTHAGNNASLIQSKQYGIYLSEFNKINSNDTYNIYLDGNAPSYFGRDNATIALGNTRQWNLTYNSSDAVYSLTSGENKFNSNISAPAIRDNEMLIPLSLIQVKNNTIKVDPFSTNSSVLHTFNINQGTFSNDDQIIFYLDHYINETFWDVNYIVVVLYNSTDKIVSDIEDLVTGEKIYINNYKNIGKDCITITNQNGNSLLKEPDITCHSWNFNQTFSIDINNTFSTFSNATEWNFKSSMYKLRES